MKRIKILIAEDEPVNLKLMRMMLEEIGYEVFAAKDGEEALTLMKSNIPDLVILDIMMPKINGLEVCRIIKDNRDISFTPVMIVSALDDQESKKIGMENGADEFLSKPVDKFELQTRIKTLLKIKKLYDNLKSSQIFLRQIIDNLPHMIFVQDENSNLVMVNKSMAESFGKTVEQCLGKKISEIYDAGMEKPPEKVLEFVESSNSMILEKGKRLFLSDFPFIDIKGRKKSLQITKLPISMSESKRGVLGVTVDITKLKSIQEKLEKANKMLEIQAITDSLTGLLNHRAIYEKLEDETNRARRYNSQLSVIMMDIDDFKEVNDRWGHQMGDRVLKEISKIIKKNIREMDNAGRYGGEEFLVILPFTDINGAVTLANRIREEVSSTKYSSGIHLTISGGISVFKDENTLLLVEKADVNLYKAKKLGKNKIVS